MEKNPLLGKNYKKFLYQRWNLMKIVINLPKMKSLVIKNFTNGLTQELKLVGQQMFYNFILGEWQENAKESMDINKLLDLIFLFEDKAYENWWMSNQVSIIVFEIEHPFWLFGSHDLKAFSKWLLQFKNYNKIMIITYHRHGMYLKWSRYRNYSLMAIE
jgi:hypothetical protein